MSELGNYKPGRRNNLHMDWNISKCEGYHKMVPD